MKKSKKGSSSKATKGRAEAMHEGEDLDYRTSSRNPDHYESSRGESYGPGSFYGGEGYGKSGGYSSRDERENFGRGEGYSRKDGYGRSEQFSRKQSERGDSYGPYREDHQQRGESYGRGDGYDRNSYDDGLRTISGRYSNFEISGGSSRQGSDRDESERGFSRAGRRREYSSGYDHDINEGYSSRSPWRETYDTDRDTAYRGSSRSQDYGGQGRENSERQYNDDSRVNSRGSQYGSHRGYNEGSYNDRERSEQQYGSGRNRNFDERSMNNYDNQDESEEDAIGYRSRYNENRY